MNTPVSLMFLLSSTQGYFYELLIISKLFLYRKPVVISFGHCADLTSLSAWEMGVYHCDSLFSDGDDTPWVKLSSVGESFPVQTSKTSFPVQTSTMSSQSSSGSSKASSQASSSRKANSSPSILVSFLFIISVMLIL